MKIPILTIIFKNFILNLYFCDVRKEKKKIEKIKGQDGEKQCHHPFLKSGKIPGEKICTACKRVIYLSPLPPDIALQ
jgi:hypothetical protein